MTAIMIQGAGSNVGKSLIVAGLCRAARNRGLSVAPFKPQNMSNNAAVTVDGGEIGRAQALQALACGLEPHTDMNPVLLKPESETGSQVVVQGKRLTTVKAREYAALKPALMAPVLDSFNRLKAAYDLIIVEGAGSPAEVNLRAGDIANMGFARAAQVPVVLVGDIGRGGVIAQMVGTQAVLDPADEGMIKAFLINKFRGDPRLFDEGYRLIETRTTWPGLGVIPYFRDAWRLPAEDALDITRSTGTGTKVACLTLSRIANFDDLDPLKSEPGVQVVMVGPGEPIPADAALIIIPGSKSTRADLTYLRAQGWDIDILAHHRRGTRILGICGGYQMLGTIVSDPDGIEGPAGDTLGLGLLNIQTTMQSDKRLTQTHAIHAKTGLPITAYEIHIGRSTGPDTGQPFATIDGLPEGATNGNVTGTYLHGMFSSDTFRAAYLHDLGLPGSVRNHAAEIDHTLDAIADHMESHIDVDRLLRIAAQGL
ncbi:MAG: cobyric acid synthase [Candidatus Saccharibacteria bacterium]|nr:cobyric acid synthase [Pseudorhodobacter sp.]